ncbi:Ig-like domain-containing protein [Pyxidicoccus sp. 3LFB2]
MNERASQGHSLRLALPRTPGLLALACTLLLVRAARAEPDPQECEALPPPSAPTVFTPAEQALLATADPTFTGTADPGTSISVVHGNLTMSSWPVMVVGADGTWSFTPSFWGEFRDGTHEVTIYTTDACGHSSASVMRTFHTDTQGPLAFIVSGPAIETGESTVTLDFGNDGDGVSYRCSLNEAPFAPCPDPLVLSQLTEGTYGLRVLAVDPLGNVGRYPVEHWWDVDFTPPDTFIELAWPYTPPGTSALLRVSSDEYGTFECSLDGSVFEPCEYVVSYSGLAQGTHTLAARATDWAGRTDATPATYTWVAP